MLDRFFSRWRGSRSRQPAVDGEPSSRVVLAVLSAVDLERVRGSIQQVRRQQELLQLLGMGHNTLWWQLRKQYGLPELFDFNEKTGEVYAPEAAAPKPLGEDRGTG